MKKNLNGDIFLMVLLLYYSFKRQNMAGAYAEAGAEIMEKGGAGVGAENK